MKARMAVYKCPLCGFEIREEEFRTERIYDHFAQTHLSIIIKMTEDFFESVVQPTPALLSDS